MNAHDASTLRRLGALTLTLLVAGCGQSERLAPPELSEISPSTAPTTTAPAQETPVADLPEGATLVDYLRYAEQHHPAIRAMTLRWQAAAEEGRQQRLLPDPTLNLGYETMSRERRIGIAQEIPYPGKLALREAQANAMARVEQQRIEAQRREVLRKVAEAYAEYAYLGEAMRISEQYVEIARQLEQVSLTRLRGGGAQADVLRAQIEVARMEDELRSLQDMQQPASARLNAALGRPGGALLPRPAAGVAAAGRHGDEEIAAQLQQGNAELAVLAREVERARESVKLARRESYPDFMVGLEYMRDEMEDGVGVMFSMTLPIWQQRYKSMVRQANSAFHAANQTLVERQNDLHAELQMALFGLRDAERKVALYRDNLLPRAQQALRSAETAYGAGRGDFTTLAETYRLPLEFELAIARALTDQAVRIAEIEALIGQSVGGTSNQHEIEGN